MLYLVMFYLTTDFKRSRLTFRTTVIRFFRLSTALDILLFGNRNDTTFLVADKYIAPMLYKNCFEIM